MDTDLYEKQDIERVKRGVVDKAALERLAFLTALDEWNELAEDLKRQVYHLQASALESGTWEQVCEARGFAKGLAYVISLKDQAQTLLEEL